MKPQIVTQKMIDNSRVITDRKNYLREVKEKARNNPLILDRYRIWL